MSKTVNSRKLGLWQVSFLAFFFLFPFLILCNASLIVAPEQWVLPPQDFLFKSLLCEQCSVGIDKSTGGQGGCLWGLKVAKEDQENLYLSFGCLALSFSSWSQPKRKPLFDCIGPLRPLVSLLRCLKLWSCFFSPPLSHFLISPQELPQFF